MIGTLIGLVGVLVGVLLGGVVGLRGDRRNRRVRAIAAATLVGAEIEAITSMMAEAAELESQWWAGVLPTQRWRSLATDLAFDIDDGTMDKLSSFYSLVDGWNAVATLATASHQPPDHRSEESNLALANLANRGTALGKTLSLKREALRIKRKRERLSIRVVVGAVWVAVATVSLIAILMPRPYLTDGSVAQSVATALGPGHVVECTKSGEAWNCLAYPTATCPNFTSTSAEAAPSPAAELDVALNSRPSATCPVRGPPESIKEVNDGNQLVGTPTGGNHLLAILDTPRQTRSWWSRFTSGVAGSD
jgi:hypothetical protein